MSAEGKNSRGIRERRGRRGWVSGQQANRVSLRMFNPCLLSPKTQAGYRVCPSPHFLGGGMRGVQSS